MFAEEMKRAYELGYREPITPPILSKELSKVISSGNRTVKENLALAIEYGRG